MNGPEHYRQAEKILADLQDAATKAGKHPIALDLFDHWVARAQAHATLAQVAITYDVATSAAPAGITNDVEWYAATNSKED